MLFICICVPGTGPGQTVGLNLKTWLYVGGVDWSDVRVSPSVGVDVGFTGCIAEVSRCSSRTSNVRISLLFTDFHVINFNTFLLPPPVV